VKKPELSPNGTRGLRFATLLTPARMSRALLSITVSLRVEKNTPKTLSRVCFHFEIISLLCKGDGAPCHLSRLCTLTVLHACHTLSHSTANPSLSMSLFHFLSPCLYHCISISLSSSLSSSLSFFLSSFLSFSLSLSLSFSPPTSPPPLPSIYFSLTHSACVFQTECKMQIDPQQPKPSNRPCTAQALTPKLECKIETAPCVVLRSSFDFM
jgi:hypothetical protein